MSLKNTVKRIISMDTKPPDAAETDAPKQEQAATPAPPEQAAQDPAPATPEQPKAPEPAPLPSHFGPPGGKHFGGGVKYNEGEHMPPDNPPPLPDGVDPRAWHRELSAQGYTKGALDRRLAERGVSA